MRLRRTSTIALAILALACSSPPEAPIEAPGEPVAIIGWDGATWEVIDPLIEAGRLPNLARVLEGGARGTLVAREPLLSPVAWTTLATGFPENEHGITGFHMPSPDGGDPILASSFHRKRAAIWQMVSAAPERDVGFIGWWSTWPAEPVNGYLVSDHLAYNRWDAWARRPQNDLFQLTHPPELAEELASIGLRPEAIEAADLLQLAAFDAGETREMMQARRPLIFHAPSVLRFGFSTDASNFRYARYLLETRDQPSLFAVSFVLTDVAGHVFWDHYQPAAFADAPADAGRLGEAIPNVYEQVDRWTGELIAKLSPDTRILILSDHGMRSTGRRAVPGQNPAGDHDPRGILAATGPGIPVGTNLDDVSSLDLVPTLLALLGLPVASDMPGRVLQELAAEDASFRLAWTDSYGTGIGEGRDPVESPASLEYQERLRALGYIK